MFTNFKRQLRYKLITVAALLAVLSVVFIITQRGRSGDHLNGDQIMQDEQTARRQENGIGPQSSSVTASKSQTLGNPQLPPPQSSERLPDNRPEQHLIATPISFIMQRHLIYKTDIVYPETAKSLGLFDEVKLEVTVGENGAVEETKIIRGNPMFAEAAIDAVNQWRYEPTLVDGKPISVIFGINIVFRPNGNVGVYAMQMEASDVNYVSLIADNLTDTSVRVDSYFNVVHIAGQEGGEYHSVTSDMSPPVIQIDKQGIRDMVYSIFPNDDRIRDAVKFPSTFRIFINEKGDIDRIRQSDRKIDALEKDLQKYLSVQSPTSYNGEAIPSWIDLTIDVPQIIN